MSDAKAIGREEIRAALTERGGDLRAVATLFGLTTQQVLMILAYDVSMTSRPTRQSSAQSVMDAIDASLSQPRRRSRP